MGCHCNVTPPQPECSQELCSEPATPTKVEGQRLESKAAPKPLHKSPEGERDAGVLTQ